MSAENTPGDTGPIVTGSVACRPAPFVKLRLPAPAAMPAGVTPPRRTSELTVAILQLVASGRGVAALPLWAVDGYLARGYVARQRVGEGGLTGRLYAVSTTALAAKPFLADFVRLMRETSLLNLAGVSLL